MKIGFFETEQWEEDYLKSHLPDHELYFYQERADKEHMPDRTDYDAISVFTGSKIDADVLASFSNLKLIATRTTGFDHIDLPACKEKGIFVSSVPFYGENTVAEFAFGLILSISRKIWRAYDRIKETGSWSLEGLQGFDLKGKTIGIVGLGRIGKHLAKMAKGFEMNIVAYDPHPDENFAKENDIKMLALPELLGISDIISIHVPYMPTTHHLINKNNIGLIKRGAVLINTARGGIVETDALAKALNDGILSGAGLDVLEEETPTKDEREFLIYGRTDEHDLKTVLENNMLVDMPNVIITPHNAFNTKEALIRILDTTLQNITAFEAGKPENIVK